MMSATMRNRSPWLVMLDSDVEMKTLIGDLHTKMDMVIEITNILERSA